MQAMIRAAILALVTAVLPQVLRAGPDGLDIVSSTNVRLEMIFACGDDDAMCLKARDTNTNSPDYDVRGIITSNVMIYNDGYRGTKIGTETDAEFFEDIVYENIYVVKAGTPNTLYLTDTATVRNVIYKNFYVENAGNFAVGTFAFAGRTPTGRAENITVSNLVSNSTLLFSGFSPSTATRDSGAINFRQRSSGNLVTDVSTITGSNTANITLGTNPVIAKEINFPIEGSVHTLPGEVLISARVFHENGDPVTVEFFANGVSVGTDSTAPYEILWNAPEGDYGLTFTVTDGASNSDTLLAPRRFSVQSTPEFSSVEVVPGDLDIGPGLSRDFQARALDQYGNLLEPQPVTWTWSVSPGSGSVDASGTVTAVNTEGGPHLVTAEATVGGNTLNGSATFTITNTLELSNLFVATGKAYVWDTLANGKLVYMDRSTTLSNIPSQYLGKFYLRNSNSDKNVSGTVASFQVNLPVTVYVAVTGDFDTTREWFDGFVDTGTFLMGKRVYAKAHEPGVIALGQNGTPNMYHVFLNYPLTANSDPQASFTSDTQTGQAPLTVNFDGSSSIDFDGSVVRYDWDFGDGNTRPDGGALAQHTYSAPGNFSVSLTVTDDQGATDTETLTDYIFVGNAPPVADFSFSPLTVETGDTVSFDASASFDPDGTIVRYDWDFGDGTVLNNGGAMPSHSYSTEEVFQVELTVTDDDGATSKAGVAISTIPPGSVDLLYRFDFEANGGVGATVNDVSGFGIAADGTTFESSTPVSVFTSTAPSPDGEYYGNFESSRTTLRFSSDKWNDDVNGIAGGSNAFTVTLLIRDFDGTSVDADGTNFFQALNNDLQFGFTGGTGPRPLHFRANDGTRVTTSIAADLSNATTGDSNGWILLAMTYASETDTARFYLGREFSADSGWNLTLLESLSYPTSSLNDIGSVLSFQDDSARDPDAKFDDLRIYNGELSSAEIALIGAASLAPLATVEADITEDEDEWIISISSQTGYAYQLRTATALSENPLTWQSIGSPESGADGVVLEFRLLKSEWSDDQRRFFVIGIQSQ